VSLNLDPLVTGVIGGSGLTGTYLAFRFLDWLRRGKIEDADSTIKRLIEAVDREKARADDAEAAEDRRRVERDLARELYQHERDYVSVLRSQLFDARITPVARPGTITPGREETRP
jgi:hypothetical protein